MSELWFCLSFLVALAGLVLVVIGLGRKNIKKSRGGLAKHFGDIKTEFDGLKARFDAKSLNEAQFKTQLQNLMVQDPQGRWWMIGYETGQWYVHNGSSWDIGHPDPGWVIKPQEQEAAKNAPRKLPFYFWIGLGLIIFGTWWFLAMAGIIR